MNTRYDVPETVASLRKVDKEGEETYYEDCTVGIECQNKGVLQIDLRNLRPIRINDRESLVIELDIAEVLGSIAVGVRNAIKE